MSTYWTNYFILTSCWTVPRFAVAVNRNKPLRLRLRSRSQTATIWRFFLIFPTIAHSLIFCINTFSDLPNDLMILFSYVSNVTHRFSEKNISICTPNQLICDNLNSEKLSTHSTNDSNTAENVNKSKKVYCRKKIFFKFFSKNVHVIVAVLCCGFRLRLRLRSRISTAKRGTVMIKISKGSAQTDCAKSYFLEMVL